MNKTFWLRAGAAAALIYTGQLALLPVVDGYIRNTTPTQVQYMD